VKIHLVPHLPLAELLSESLPQGPEIVISTHAHVTYDGRMGLLAQHATLKKKKTPGAFVELSVVS